MKPNLSAMTAINGTIPETIPGLLQQEDDIRSMKHDSWTEGAIDILRQSLTTDSTESRIHLDEPEMGSNGTVYDTPYYLFITVNVFYGVIFLFGTLGNIIVIFVSCRSSTTYNSSTRIYVTNLGVSDLLVLWICMSSSLIDFHMKEVWILGDAMCRVVPYLENLVAHSSIMFITGISCDRFYAICRPMRVHTICTTRRTARVVVVIWGLTIVASLPFLILTGTEEARFYDGSIVTVCRTSIDTALKQAYVIAIVTVFFALPFALLTVVYTLIIRKLRQEEAQVERRFGPSTTCQAVYKKRRCVVYILIFLVFFVFISLLPIRALALWSIYSTNEQKHALGFEAYLNLISAVRILLYLNSVVNPVLYNVVSSRFREAFRRAVSRDSRRSSAVFNSQMSRRMSQISGGPRMSNGAMLAGSARRPGIAVRTRIRLPPNSGTLQSTTSSMPSKERDSISSLLSSSSSKDRRPSSMALNSDPLLCPRVEFNIKSWSPPDRQ